MMSCMFARDGFLIVALYESGPNLDARMLPIGCGFTSWYRWTSPRTLRSRSVPKGRASLLMWWFCLLI